MAAGYHLAAETDLLLALTDISTKVSPISTLFLNQPASVTIDGLQWEGVKETNSSLSYTTRVNGNVQATGTIKLPSDAIFLPTSIFAGNISVSEAGSNTIEVVISVTGQNSSSLGEEQSTSKSIQSFRAWSSIIPLLVVLVLAVTSGRVELSLICGIFVGACMIAGSLTGGFKRTLDTYLLDAVANPDHVSM